MQETDSQVPEGALVIAEQGMFSAGGTMTTTPSDQTWYTQFRIGTYLNNEFTRSGWTPPPFACLC